MSVEFHSKIVNPEFPQIFDILPEELHQKQTQVKLVDVRRPDEFTGELGHIPGAQLMTLDTLPEKISTLPKDQTIVFICRSGGRSGRAAAFAFENGLEDVYNMKGGMLLWNELHFEVER